MFPAGVEADAHGSADHRGRRWARDLLADLNVILVAADSVPGDYHALVTASIAASLARLGPGALPSGRRGAVAGRKRSLFLSLSGLTFWPGDPVVPPGEDVLLAGDVHVGARWKP